jgi:hypothetical protein
MRNADMLIYRSLLLFSKNFDNEISCLSLPFQSGLTIECRRGNLIIDVE